MFRLNMRNLVRMLNLQYIHHANEKTRSEMFCLYNFCKLKNKFKNTYKNQI